MTPEVCGALLRAVDNGSPIAFVCQLIAGHEGRHEDELRKFKWTEARLLMPISDGYTRSIVEDWREIARWMRSTNPTKLDLIKALTLEECADELEHLITVQKPNAWYDRAPDG